MPKAPDSDTSADGPISAGPSEDMAQRFAVLRALADATVEAATVDASSGGTPRAAKPADEPRYRFEGVFASGGLGTIRRAYDRRLERHVAVKELQNFVPGGASEARFHREALLTARLEHPSIVPIQDRGVHPDGSPYFCMKLIDGRSLDQLVRACRSLGDRLALVPHVLAVADALAYAHARGVVHRDLKPANILVGPFGETLVIDWGLAKDLLAGDSVDVRSAPLRSDAPSDDLTHTGEFVGTLPFMPLEQAEGADTDARADVYAIGAILYFVLSGCLPYEGRPALPMLSAMLAGPPVDLAERVAGVPADLLAIVRKAMARKPADRYPSAQELAADLRRFSAGQMVAARPYSPIDVLRHFGRRHRAIVGVASVGLAMLAGVGTYSYAQVLQQQREAEAQRAQAVEAREAESAALAVSEERRAESEAQARAARASSARLLTESARRELFVDQRPQQALVLLAEAARLGAVDLGTKTMLAGATRAVDARRMTLAGHAGGVKALKHDRSGRRMLARSGSGDVHLWDLASGEQLAHLTASEGRYNDATFVADNDDEIVTMTDKGLLTRHDLDGRTLAQTTAVATDALGRNPMARSLGGDSVLVIHSGGLQVVDLATGATRPSPRVSGPEPLANLPLGAEPGKFALVESWVASHRYDAHYFRLLRWDLASGKLQASPELGRNLTELIAASPDGRRVAFVDAAQGQALWDVEAGKQITLASCGPFPARRGLWEQVGSFTPDGGQLLRLVGDDHVARWDIATGKCARVSAPLGSSADRLEVTPDGDHVVLTHDDAQVSVLDRDTLALRLRFLAHIRPIGALAIAPDSATMATGGQDGEIRVWSLADPRVLHRVEISGAVGGPPGDGRVYALGRRHDGRETEFSFGAGMNPGAVEPGGVRTLSRIDGEPAPGAAPATVVLDPAAKIEHLWLVRDDLLLGASAWTHSAALWSGDAPGLRGAIDYSASNLSGVPVTISPDHRHLWVRAREIDGDASMVQRYSLPDFKLERSLDIPRVDEMSATTLRGVAFGEPGMKKYTAKIYDLESGALIKEVDGAFGNFSPAGERLFLATMDGAIRAHDALTGELIATLREPTPQMLNTLTSGTPAAVFSPDKATFATSRIDGTIDLWRSDTLAWVRELRGHLAPARHFEFSADGQRLLSHRWAPSGGDTMTFLWQLGGPESDGVQLDVTDLYVAHFSPDGRLLATGSSDGVVRLWDGASGDLAAELRGHKTAVTVLEFAPSGERLISGASDDAVITWQVPIERRTQAELDALIAAQVPFALVDGEVVRR